MSSRLPSKNVFLSKMTSLVEITIPLYRIQILQILVELQLIRQPIQARGSSLLSLLFFSQASNVIAYALQPQAFRCASCGFLNLLLARQVQNLLYSDFHPLLSRGVRSRRQTIQLTISFHKSYSRLAAILIARALSIITPPKRSAVPFCAQVYGAKGSNIIPYVRSQLRVLLLPSSLSNLIVLTLRLYLRRIHRIKSLSTYSVSFSSPCVVIKYGKVLPKQVSWISITRINPAYASLRSIQSIQRSRQGLSIFCSKNLLKT